MPKYGISIKLDVTKLDKSRFFKGQKGVYADLTAFFDTEEESQYGDNGTVRQSTSKEEREQGVKLPIAGNVKVFYGANQQPPQQQQDYFQGGAQDEEDVPF